MWNLSGIKDPELDALIEAAEAATTLEEQMRHARQADMYMIEKQWYVRGPHAAKFNAIQPWVKGYNGEVQLGSMDRMVIFSRLRIDQELKKEMGFQAILRNSSLFLPPAQRVGGKQSFLSQCAPLQVAQRI